MTRETNKNTETSVLNSQSVKFKISVEIQWQKMSTNLTSPKNQ